MITEDYVSFEVAKLLKKRGFEGYSIFTIYDENAANAYIKELQEKHLPYSSDDPKFKEFYYTQPTLQMAMKWLRVKFNLEIYPFHDAIQENNDWWYRLELHSKVCSLTEHESDAIYKTYEQACEGAIKYCLENLI